MENAIYVGISRQMALRSNLDIVSNNVANMSTPGFRAQNLVFDEYLTGQLSNGDELSMVVDVGQYQDTTQGSLNVTGNQLDVALSGPGFFGVETAGGTMYTRAGNFELNVDGELVTPTGYRVLDSGGGVINIPDDVKDIQISSNGYITSDQGVIAQLMVVEFDENQKMEAKGNNVYSSDVEGVEATETQVVQGALEGSNVNPISEMTKLIEISRSYQSAYNMIYEEHDMQRTMIEKLTKV